MRLPFALLVTTLLVPTLPVRAEVLRATELTADRIAALDRSKTVVLLVGGILEEHGPWSPISADGLRNDRIAEELAQDLSARGRTVLVLPHVPLGTGAFDQSMGRRDFGGSFAVRARTLQAVFLDLADELGRQGFRTAFIVHGHGEPDHNRALDLAGDYFHETYGGTMVHLLGRDGCQPETLPGPPAELASKEALDENGDSPHADLLETARVLYLRPDLTPPGLEKAPVIPGRGFPSWRAAAQKKDWPGYIGAPRYATRALGQWEMERQSKACRALALRLVDGLDERTVPRYADRMKKIPPVQKALDAARREEDAQAARQDRFLRKHR